MTIPSGVKARRVPATARSGKIPKIVVSLSCSAKPLVARNTLGPKKEKTGKVIAEQYCKYCMFATLPVHA